MFLLGLLSITSLAIMSILSCRNCKKSQTNTDVCQSNYDQKRHNLKQINTKNTKNSKIDKHINRLINEKFHIDKKIISMTLKKMDNDLNLIENIANLYVDELYLPNKL